MDIKERAAHLKGFAEGLGIDDSTPERKLILALIEAIGDMADEIEDLCDEIEDLENEVEELESGIDDLDNLLAAIYKGEMGEDGCDCENCAAHAAHGHVHDEHDGHDHSGHDHSGHDHSGHDHSHAGHFHSHDEIEKLELECPACGKTIEISEEMYGDGFFECPHCKEKLEIDFDDEDDE